MTLMMHYKYYYFLIYLWLKLKLFDLSASENDNLHGMEGVHGTYRWTKLSCSIYMWWEVMIQTGVKFRSSSRKISVMMGGCLNVFLYSIFSVRFLSFGKWWTFSVRFLSFDNVLVDDRKKKKTNLIFDASLFFIGCYMTYYPSSLLAFVLLDIYRLLGYTLFIPNYKSF
jgi:hypothetical protein